MPQAKRKTTTRPAPAGPAIIDPAELPDEYGMRAKHPEWSIVTDLEAPLSDIHSFTRILLLLDMGSDDDDLVALHTVARYITKLVETVEEGRGKLFYMLHPSRAEFDAAGGVEKWREKLRPVEGAPKALKEVEPHTCPHCDAERQQAQYPCCGGYAVTA